MQIGFVRDRDDDRELWTWLAERYDLLCLPRIAMVADGLHPIAPIDGPRTTSRCSRARTRGSCWSWLPRIPSSMAANG